MSATDPTTPALFLPGVYVNVIGKISVFALSFAAFFLSVLSGWVVADTFGVYAEGAVVGGISSLFLALVLTSRRALFGKIILSGALAGLIGFPAAVWLQSQLGGFAGGAIFGLILGMSHWRALLRQVSPSWVVVSTIVWGLGFGALQANGVFYGLLLGAVIFAFLTSLAGARPFGIVRGWATQPKQKPYRKNPRSGYLRPELPSGSNKARRAQIVKKSLLVQRAGSRRKG
jgi:hypothetical protein